MLISRCDKCKKIIKKGKKITVGYEIFHYLEFCEKCGKSVILFLKRNKLLKVEKTDKTKS